MTWLRRGLREIFKAYPLTPGHGAAIVVTTMPSNLFLELLLTLPSDRLRELYAEADEKVKEGELERRYIGRALQERGGAVEPARVEARAVHNTAKPGAAREPIIQIAQSDADHVWMPSEMRNLLRERYGLDIATGTIRAAMKRLVDEKVLARPTDSPNGFKLASANGSHPEPPTEATNSAPGGYGRQDALAP
jgi:hypothetical protein